MINLKQQAVIVHCTTQVYRQQYVACQLYRHEFSNDVVSTVKHGIITNYNVCISDIVFQYHSFQPHFTRYPQYLHKNPSNFQHLEVRFQTHHELLSQFPPSRSLNFFPRYTNGFGLYGLLSWLPSFFSEQYGTSLSELYLGLLGCGSQTGRWKFGEFIGDSQKRAPF